jgi:hypothetical protein
LGLSRPPHLNLPGNCRSKQAAVASSPFRQPSLWKRVSANPPRGIARFDSGAAMVQAVGAVYTDRFEMGWPRQFRDAEQFRLATAAHLEGHINVLNHEFRYKVDFNATGHVS